MDATQLDSGTSRKGELTREPYSTWSVPQNHRTSSLLDDEAVQWMASGTRDGLMHAMHAEHSPV
ncbi:hypothetical protein D187_006965 [Cystobacter fuscus DSM 2262]|uniref:Uncharacterized protein n=1 Tax=Cystobacter fuscus (strain ATCC 25194 / DSM 2262 / NBRC 100088 / M29) TaxID=1242864 RepID=S9P264_CYSF2|nr:hypothetical protein D187_006965 [Cystobacter fuscus DSM 2262]